MVKSIDIFRNITDLEAFKKILAEEVCPTILKIPGVTQLKITRVTPLSTDLSQDVEGIELILEIYLESEEALASIIKSPEAQQAMAQASKLPGELSLFLGREETITLKKDFE